MPGLGQGNGLVRGCRRSSRLKREVWLIGSGIKRICWIIVFGLRDENDYEM